MRSPSPVRSRRKSAASGAAIYWTGSSGPFTAWHEIGACYENFGGPAGPLGYPTSERSQALASPRGTEGLYQRFERGSIYWSERHGGHPVCDAIAAHYEGLGGTASRLGFPIADPSGDTRAGMPAGALRQRFENGWITWQPGQDAQAAFD